jgi:hypothetical protein
MKIEEIQVSAPKLWPDSTIAVLASGPSLTREDADYVRSRVDAVIVVNGAYELAQWADCLYGSDIHKFWTWRQGVPEFHGLKYTVWTEAGRRKAAAKLGIPALRHVGDTGLSLDPTSLKTGKNITYAAMNLAVHLGAKRIVLLGVDMQRGPKGQMHCHADHPDGSGPPCALAMTMFPTLISPLKEAGVSVVNCTRRTALACFPLEQLELALP